MSPPSRTSPPLIVTSAGWQSELLRPAMANVEDPRAGLELTNRGLLRDGQHWVPVSGEIHYSRVPRHRWEERVAQMLAGGISVVACYVPWLHHAPGGPVASFDDYLDVGAFVDIVRKRGLEVVLRIGPWAHGEMRNGGFPDWVQASPVQHRTNDAGYLELVRGWWSQLAIALGDRLSSETILGIQLENELYDQPDHIRELKRLARELGFSAPFWTATAWGHAQLPEPEVFPLYGGYGDGFWVDQGEPWDPSFRDHFFFSDVWDDPGIGADLRATSVEATDAIESRFFPPATCELGGGMATAYHRRPVPTARDIATVAHIKVGNGSSWQGYYMYAGGTNPADGTQESHATGYPNDVPPLSYDFHAPIGEAGRLAPSHAELRRQNAFLDAFGSRIGGMPSHLPTVRPSGVTDSQTLRWSFRGDDRSGFLFIAWHQPHVALTDYVGAQFAVVFGDVELRLPSSPVDIPTGTIARWPVRFESGGVEIAWLTASVLTLLPGEVPTLVAVAELGIPVELAISHEQVIRSDYLEPGLVPTRLGKAHGGALDLLVLPSEVSDDLWVQASERGVPVRLLRSRDEIAWDADGRVTARSGDRYPEVSAYDSTTRSFRSVPLEHTGGTAETVELEVVKRRNASDLTPPSFGDFEGRPSAPSTADIDQFAAVYTITTPAIFNDPDACLEIEWAGDVAQLRVDGEVVADRFWDGSLWRVNTVDRGIRAGTRLELWLVPMRPDSVVHLPEKAALRRATAGSYLESVDRVRVVRRAIWTES